MPHDNLSSEERLSPIKLSNIKEPAVKERMDENEIPDRELLDSTARPTFSGLIKHPHGLQAKHDYRRNTLTHPSSFKTPSKHSIRDVVTSPRLVAPILQPDHTDSIADSPSYRIRSKRASLLQRTHEPLHDINNKPSLVDLPSHASPYKKRSSDDFTISVSKQKKYSIVDTPNGSDMSSNYKVKPLEEMNSSPEKSKNQPGNLTSTLATSSPAKNDDGKNESLRSDKGANEYPVSREERLVYTASQMELSRQNLYHEITKLESSIKSKNGEIISLSSALNECENKILRLEEGLDETLREKAHLEESSRLSALQIEHLDKDLVSTHQKLEAKITLLKESENNYEVMRKNQEKEIEKMAVETAKLEEHITQVEIKLSQSTQALNELRSENEDLKLQVRNMSEERLELQKDVDNITNSRDLLLAKLEELRSDKEILTTRLDSQQDELSVKNDQLAELNQKFKELCEETSILHVEMAKFETEQKFKDEELSSKTNSIEELKSIRTHLEEEVASLKAELESNRELLHDDTNTKSNLQSENERLLEVISDLRNQNLEKDQIISGDTKKLTELVEEVNKQKQLISDFKMNANKGETNSEDELLKQIASLKHQVATAQQKTDERIQDVAEQLYHQYSKKHELKVNQLKEKYDAKIEESLSELESKRREIETLDSQLKTEVKEKNYLLSALEKSDASSKRTPSRKRF